MHGCQFETSPVLQRACRHTCQDLIRGAAATMHTLSSGEASLLLSPLYIVPTTTTSFNVNNPKRAVISFLRSVIASASCHTIVPASRDIQVTTISF